MKYCLFLLIVFAFQSFAQDYNTIIECNYPYSKAEEKVFINVDSKKVDSIVVEKGSFSWKCNLDGISRIMFFPEKSTSFESFIIDSGEYVIEYDTSNYYWTAPISKEKIYSTSYKIKENKALTIHNDYQDLNAEFDKLDSLTHLNPEVIFSRKGEMIQDFLDKYEPTVASRIFFKSPVYYEAFKFLPIEVFKKYYQQSDSIFKNSAFAKEKLEYIDKMALSEMGKPLTEIKAYTPDSNLLSVDSFRGKYVLVEFWASWCKPCRAESPLLRQLYEDYNPKGFEIVSFSLDHELEKWKSAIEADSLDWAHISDLKGWRYDNSLVDKFGIIMVPYNILIDPQGIVIDKWLRGDALEKRIAQIFE